MQYGPIPTGSTHSNQLKWISYLFHFSNNLKLHLKELKVSKKKIQNKSTFLVGWLEFVNFCYRLFIASGSFRYLLISFDIFQYLPISSDIVWYLLISFDNFWYLPILKAFKNLQKLLKAIKNYQKLPKTTKSY